MAENVIGTGIETDMYMKLCRNIDLRPPKDTKELYCKYESKNKPYYMYGPRKVEIVSLSPYIAGTYLGPDHVQVFWKYISVSKIFMLPKHLEHDPTDNL